MQPPRPRRGELDEVRDRPRAPFLREPDQRHEDLGGRRRVGQRTVARLGRGAEEVGQAGEPEVPRAAGEQPAGQPDGVDDGSRYAAAREPEDGMVEERHVEAGVVGDEHGVAREGEEAPHGEVLPGRAPEVAPGRCPSGP